MHDCHVAKNRQAKPKKEREKKKELKIWNS